MLETRLLVDAPDNIARGIALGDKKKHDLYTAVYENGQNTDGEIRLGERSIGVLVFSTTAIHA